MVISKWIDWPQNKCSSQSTKEWTPQCFQWKIVANLNTWNNEKHELLFVFRIINWSNFNTTEICYDSVCTSSKLKSTPPMGAPKATLTPAADAADKIWNIKHTLTIFIPWLLFPFSKSGIRCVILLYWYQMSWTQNKTRDWLSLIFTKYKQKHYVLKVWMFCAD